MRKYFIFFFVFCLISASASAKYCIKCGAQIADVANFCPLCGAKQISAKKTEPNRINSQPRITIDKNYDNKSKQSDFYLVYKNKVLNLFAIVDKFEKSVRAYKYLNVVGSYPDYKVRFANSVRAYNRYRAKLPISLQVLGDAYIAKSHSFDTIVKIMRSFGINFGLKDSIIRASYHEIDLYNEIIGTIRINNNEFDKNEDKNLVEKLSNVKKRMMMYKVTSPYLKLNRDKMARGSKFIVVNVKNKFAYVLFIGESQTNDVVEGKIGLKSLTKRTTWEKNNILYYK